MANLASVLCYPERQDPGTRGYRGIVLNEQDRQEESRNAGDGSTSNALIKLKLLGRKVSLPLSLSLSLVEFFFLATFFPRLSSTSPRWPLKRIRSSVDTCRHIQARITRLRIIVSPNENLRSHLPTSRNFHQLPMFLSVSFFFF